MVGRTRALAAPPSTANAASAPSRIRSMCLNAGTLGAMSLLRGAGVACEGRRWLQPAAANARPSPPFHSGNCHDPNPLAIESGLTHLTPLTATVAANARALPLQLVERTPNAKLAAVQHVCVHHRRRHVRVPEQLLHRLDIVTIDEQVCRKRMAKDVRADPLGETGLSCGLPNRPLHDRFVNVIPRRRAELRIATDARRREHELPAPLARRLRILAAQCTGQDDRPNPSVRSRSCWRFTSRRCIPSRSSMPTGNIVTRSFWPLPRRTTI